MDFVLDIVILREELDNINLYERMIEWGGDFFPHDPPQYLSSSNLLFEQITDWEYYSRLIGKDMDEKKYIALHLKGQELLDIEMISNTRKNDLANNILVVFLEKLCDLREFYILLLREDEIVKKSYTIETKEELTKVLCESLNWVYPQDTLIMKT